MTGLDTNILVRYLTQDDPNQAKRATRAIEEGTAHGQSFFIADIVLCQLVWVLETAYKYKRTAISAVLEQVLQTRQFRFIDKELLWLSLTDYRQYKGDFADYLIGRIGLKAGASQTLTFDKILQSTPHFSPV